MISATKEQVEEAVVKIITENKNNDRETGLGEVRGAGLSSYILILMSAAMVIVFCPNFGNASSFNAHSGGNKSICSAQ